MNDLVNKTQLADKRALFRKQIESDREIKQNEKRQKREILVEEDIDLGRNSNNQGKVC